MVPLLRNVRKTDVGDEDAVIAKGLNAGLRRLVVRALVHSAGSEHDEARMDELMQVLTAEIGRLAFKGESGDGQDTDLTAAVRNALMILLKASRREAQSGLTREAKTLQ
jgi:hypothetical protein